MDGIFLLDKKENISSRSACDELKKKLDIKDKIGHTGTLDPLASGLLVVIVGKATKLNPYIDNTTKEYVVELEFGKKSDTYDICGKILSDIDCQIKRDLFVEKLAILAKKTTQIPPIYSAIKVKGKKLYQYALENKEVLIEERNVKVYDYEIIDFNGKMAKIRLLVNKGFYVRSFVSDLGELLGVGAIMTSLRRTKAGKFNLDQAFNIDEIKNDSLIDMKKLLEDYPRVKVSPYIANLVKNGIILDERQTTLEEPFVVESDGIDLALYEPINNHEYKIVLRLL